MIHIKRMQGFVEDVPVKKVSTIKKPDIFADYNQHNKKTMKLIRNTKKQLDGLNRLSSGQDKSPKFSGNSADKLNKNNLLRKKSMHATECPYYKTAVEAFKESLDKPHKLKEIGTQTEQFYTLKQLYESGTIKYPSQQVYCSVPPVKQDKGKIEKEKVKHKGDGDKKREEKPLEQKTISADMSPDKKHDYVKENAQIVRNSSCKSNQSRNTDPTMAPPTYQKGVIPKYLRERKEELYSQVKSANNNEKCPDGHVVLPDNERKETLRMLRQSKHLFPPHFPTFFSLPPLGLIRCFPIFLSSFNNYYIFYSLLLISHKSFCPFLSYFLTFAVFFSHDSSYHRFKSCFLEL